MSSGAGPFCRCEQERAGDGQGLPAPAFQASPGSVSKAKLASGLLFWETLACLTNALVASLLQNLTPVQDLGGAAATGQETFLSPVSKTTLFCAPPPGQQVCAVVTGKCQACRDGLEGPPSPDAWLSPHPPGAGQRNGDFFLFPARSETLPGPACRLVPSASMLRDPTKHHIKYADYVQTRRQSRPGGTPCSSRDQGYDPSSASSKQGLMPTQEKSASRQARPPDSKALAAVGMQETGPGLRAPSRLGLERCKVSGQVLCSPVSSTLD